MQMEDIKKHCLSGNDPQENTTTFSKLFVNTNLLNNMYKNNVHDTVQNKSKRQLNLVQVCTQEGVPWLRLKEIRVGQF